MRSQIIFDDITELEKKIRKLPSRAEKAINSILHTEGIEIATREMTNLIPVSKVNKPHAKKLKWSEAREANLQFEIVARGGAAKNKGSFGYLVFPDEGRGPSNPLAQHFSDRSLLESAPKILEKLHGKLNEMIEEVF